MRKAPTIEHALYTNLLTTTNSITIETCIFAQSHAPLEMETRKGEIISIYAMQMKKEKAMMSTNRLKPAAKSFVFTRKFNLNCPTIVTIAMSSGDSIKLTLTRIRPSHGGIIL